MKIIEQSEITDEQKSRIVELWNTEYPQSIALDGVTGFDEYLAERPNGKHFLMLDAAGEIAGWALTFERGAARWFAIILDGKIHGKGFGGKLIDALKASENHLFGWAIDNDECRKINGEVYKSPLGFYRKIGFRIHENERISGKNFSGVKIEWNASDTSDNREEG